jgi:predicted 3-demethylubiquinone-9 3-methyltransferase (glyoxalase superfamily)
MAKLSSKVVPHLWFEKDAVEPAKLYVSLLPDSRIDSITPMPIDSPSGAAGSVQIVEFTLGGQRFTAFNGGPLDKFNHAISLMIECDDQKELDALWEKLGQGGTYEQCGWLRDRFGVCWQITPRVLAEMMKDPDRAKAKRVAEAMMKMVKLDIAELERAYQGG